ncbi:MAG: S-methyl-5'-thioadenosine phosphorylase [Kofleriaceae bacterium]|nr:S-methyl-5'-thioadenosine phosphorylase [Kofleriaceae bacterium]
MTKAVLGVIGGSGIYDLPNLENLREVSVETPFGEPSSPLMVGQIGDVTLVFLARHGAKHTILPHEINYRANIYALKSQGVQWILSLSAVGSMREHIRPGDIVIVDQFIDRSQGRAGTFFGEGIAAHVSMADPISPVLSDIVFRLAQERAGASKRDLRIHKGGTYLVMNGPQFSTRAESHMYRTWGVDVIGMTNMPEAKLAREAEMSYCTVALSTDYDCWHEDEEDVSVEAVLAVVRKNAEFAREIVSHLPALLPDAHTCIAANALQYAIMTSPDAIPEETGKRLGPIIEKYLRT